MAIDLKSAVDGLYARERADIARRYGTHDGPAMWGSTPLMWRPYHNATHADDVAAAAERIGRELQLYGKLTTDRDVQLLRLAAVFHDHEQDLGGGENERVSAEAAVRAMEEYPEIFSSEDRAKVRDGILSTTVGFDDEGRMYQKVVNPSDPFQCAVADADLSSLGQDIGVDRALMLNLEFQQRDGLWTPGAEPDRQRTQAFLDGQKSFFANHDFHLPESRRMFNPTKRGNQQLMESMASRYAANEGMTYEQLLRESHEVAGRGLQG